MSKRPVIFASTIASVAERSMQVSEARVEVVDVAGRRWACLAVKREPDSELIPVAMRPTKRQLLEFVRATSPATVSEVLAGVLSLRGAVSIVAAARHYLGASEAKIEVVHDRSGRLHVLSVKDQAGDRWRVFAMRSNRQQLLAAIRNAAPVVSGV
jgi:hypothetical protein